jgi:PAS domain S-box-containing protein
MRDDNGEPIGFRGILRDITERKEMEKNFFRGCHKNCVNPF